MDNEWVSALLDGEVDAAELDAWLESADADGARGSGAVLGRYAAIGQLMRGQAACADAGFADRVMAACTADAAGDAPVSAGGVRAAGRAANRPRRRRRWRVAGFAVAASVAAAALMLLPLLQTEEPVAPATQIASAPLLTSPVRPVSSLPATRPVRASAPAGSPRISSYVLAYSNSRAVQGFSTPLGYARLAAYTGSSYFDPGNR